MPKVKREVPSKKVVAAPYKAADKKAAAPAVPKKQTKQALLAPLFETKVKNFGIGNDIHPGRDLTRYVRWPHYVKLQRQRRVLYARLKIPPAINQFTRTLDKNTATELFKLLAKYRPEDRATKRARLLKIAAEQVKAVEDKKKEKADNKEKKHADRKAAQKEAYTKTKAEGAKPEEKKELTKAEQAAAKRTELIEKAKLRSDKKKVAATATIKDKKPNVLKYGINHITALVEQKKARLVLIANDVDPIELVVWLPALCRKMDVPYCIVKNKARLGALVHKKTATAVALVNVNKADRAEFTTLSNAIKTNYNDRFDEFRRQWGGGKLGAKSAHAQAKKRKRVQKELRI